MFKRRNKLDLLRKQLQWPKLEVCTENDSSIDDSHIYDTSDIDPIDLLIVLRKDKISCTSIYWMSYFSICLH